MFQHHFKTDNKEKYLKYKNKYLKLKAQYGASSFDGWGSDDEDEFDDCNTLS